MNNTFSNVLAGTSVLIQGGKGKLIEVPFPSGKPGLHDLVVFLALRGWQENTPLLFMSVNTEDKVFLVTCRNGVLTIMSKELCELFQDNFNCNFLTYKEIEEMLEWVKQK